MRNIATHFKSRIIRISVGIILAVMIWKFALPHRYFTDKPLSYSEAALRSPIPLPASATNVYIATYRHWIAMAQCVRFDAPVEDCMSYVSVVTNYLHKELNIVPHVEFVAIGGSNYTERGRPFDFKKKLAWFNVEAIESGVRTFKLNRSWQPQMWIDTNKGRFYYHIAD